MDNQGQRTTAVSHNIGRIQAQMQDTSKIDHLAEISDYVDQTSFSEQYSNRNSIDDENKDTISQKFNFSHIPDAPFKAIEEVPEIYEASNPTSPLTSDAYIKSKPRPCESSPAIGMINQNY